MRCAALGCKKEGTVLDDVETSPGVIKKRWVCEEHRGTLVQNITMESKFNSPCISSMVSGLGGDEPEALRYPVDHDI